MLDREVEMKQTIKVLAMSDCHGNLPPSKDMPKCDLVLIGGDICGHHGVLDQSIWLHKYFTPWLENLPAEKIIGVAGNHDFIWERAPHLVPKMPWTYLQDDFCMFKGWKIWGSPWQPRFFDWAFNLDEPDLARKWSFIHNDTDIFVLHGPPKHFGDKVIHVRPGEDGYVGSPSLAEKVREVQPKLAIFGHIHPGFGVYQCGGSTLANVSIVDEQYDDVNHPTEFILDVEKEQTVATIRRIHSKTVDERVIKWEKKDAEASNAS